MRFIKVLSLICFLTINFLAQESTYIKGKVADENNNAIAGATVVLISEKDTKVKFTTITDAGGEYNFSAIPPGKYLLSAEYKKGADNMVSPVSAINLLAEHTETADLRIDSSGQIRAEVSVIASGTGQPIDEVSKTVNIISGQEMRDRADFALAESLRTIPGFRVQQLGGFGRTATIKTRGLRNQDTAILIDGIRFRDASAITGDASAFLSDFTLTSVSRVEVLRGSGSSLYGTNAIGGTVDFQSTLR